jgi:hypothetical protein
MTAPVRATGVLALLVGAPVLPLLLLGAACGKGTDRGAVVPGTAGPGAVLRAFGAAGLEAQPGEPVDAKLWAAADCAAATVAGLTALVCAYPDDAALERGQRLIQDDWTRRAVVTGVLTRNGRTLLSLLDGSQADPTGRNANKLVKTFRGLGP